MLNDAINSENVPLSNKIPGNVMGKDLHYCIYFSLIIRTRKYVRSIVELLKNNNYVPSDVRPAHQKFAKQTATKSIPDEEYRFFDPKDHPDNELKEMKGDYKYRKCKLCPRCFSVYQIIQKYFEKNEKQSLASTPRSPGITRTQSVSINRAKTLGPPKDPQPPKPLGSPADSPNDKELSGFPFAELQNRQKGQSLEPGAREPQDEPPGAGQKPQTGAAAQSRSARNIDPQLPGGGRHRPRLKKQDVANLSFEDSSADEREMENKYKIERLTLGMQMKPLKFQLLMNSNPENSPKSQDKKSKKNPVVHLAGADIRMFVKRPAECVGEIEEYRNSFYRATVQRREECNQHTTSKAFGIRKEMLDGSNHARARAGNKRTTLNIGTANIVSFETQKSSTNLVDEGVIKRKLLKRQQLEKSFLSEVHFPDHPKCSPLSSQLFNYGKLKKISYNHCSTFKLLPNQEDYLKFEQSNLVKDIFHICLQISVPLPAVRSPNHIASRVFVYDEKVAIPYLVVSSEVMNDESKVENLVVFHDIFDNMFLMLDSYQAALREKKNKRFILFHYPGQAYTLFNSQVAYTNEYLGSFIDSLFYHLEEKNIVSFKTERFKFLGIGYGGNVLLCYRSLPFTSLLAERSLPLDAPRHAGEHLRVGRRLVARLHARVPQRAEL